MPNLPSEIRVAAREQVSLPPRERHYGLGLRAQTLMALTAAFLVSFSGLSIVIVQVAQKSHDVERGRRAAGLAEAIASSLPAISDEPAASMRRERALAGLLGHADVIGARIDALDQAPVSFGDTSGSVAASASLLDGEVLSLWIERRDGESANPLGRLLRLYSFLTGTLILTVVYVLLTRLIVRPVEDLTAAVERLSSHEEGEITIAGAAEVARLGVAFKTMARDLKLEKSQLEARLRELERTTSELRATQDQLIRSEKLAGVGRLAAGVAHEIGNPLAAILGLLELLQMGNLSRAEEAEFVARIRGETERIHLIIRDLLDYARSEPRSEDAQANLEQVLDEAVALIAPQKDLRRMTLERRVHGNDLRVRGSAHELTQIVLNLLLNAADAVAGEGHVLLDLSRDGDSVQLAITDSGAGIAAEVLGKLFDPFVTTKPAGKGTGLGLAVCLAIVERLGGSIRGENVERGARFVVRLPAVTVP